MEFLEDQIYGQKSFVSPQLLALSQNISLTESEKILHDFFDAHQDLSACFKVKTRTNNKLQIKIIDKESLKDNFPADTPKIYIVGPNNASDPAIAADIADKVQALQLETAVGKLSQLGFVTNPRLEDEYSVKDSVGFYGSKAADLRAFKPRNAFHMVHKPAPASTPEVKKESKPEFKVKTPSKREPKSMFTKTSKSEALKQTRQQPVKPKAETVIKDENPEDEEEEDGEREQNDEMDAEEEPESIPESVPESVPESLPESLPETLPESVPRSEPNSAVPASKESSKVKSEKPAAKSTTKQNAKSKPSGKPKGQSAFGSFFAPVDKSKYLEQIKKPAQTSKPVPEKVVMSKQSEQSNEGEDDEIEEKKIDRGKLDSLFDGPVDERHHAQPEKAQGEDDEDNMDVEQPEEQPEDEPEETVEPQPESIESAKEEEHEKPDAPSQESSPQKRMKKTFVTEVDDEGFDVDVQSTVFVPSDAPPEAKKPKTEKKSSMVNGGKVKSGNPQSFFNFGKKK